MKTKITSILLFLAACFSNHAQTLQWANAMLGPGGGAGKRVAVDATGNVYTVGSYSGTTDFDPGAGIFTLTPSAGIDAFVSKLDASGNFVWAVSFGGAGTDNGDAIALDAAGDVYANISSAGAGARVNVKLAAATGATVWSKPLGTPAAAISIDANNNIYLGGAFTNTVDFDPGPGTFSLTAAGTDAFITKLDASGNFLWTRAFSGASTEGCNAIAADASGNIYAIGNFSGTTDFDPGVGTFSLASAGNNDVFIAKLDASGNFGWAKRVGDFSVDNGSSIALDATGNVYSAGFFTGGLPSGAADFDPGPGTFTLNSSTGGAFVLKLDASGSFVWAKNFAGIPQCMAVDANNNVYTTGSFAAGPNDFDPGAGTYTIASAGANDIFISKLDGSGNFVLAGLMGGAANDLGQGVAVDGSGNIHLTGYFNGTADMDPTAATVNITAPGNTLGYIFHLKLASGSLPSGLNEITATNSILVYPNPFSGNVTFETNGTETEIVLMNQLGEIVLSEKSVENKIVISRGNLPKGVYFYRLSSGDKYIASGKLIAE